MTSDAQQRDVALAVVGGGADWAADLLLRRGDLSLHVITANDSCDQRVRRALAEPMAAGRVVVHAGRTIAWSAASGWKFGFEPSIDDYCGQRGIAQLRLLRLEAQGQELEILRGGVDLLRRQCIDLIQFDYGKDFQTAGITLREVYAFLVPFGYRLFRLVGGSMRPQGEILPADETYQAAQFLAALPQPVAAQAGADLPGPGVVACSSLGENGRFANQVFQYAFLRIVARHHGMEVQSSPWIGQELFGHKDAPTIGHLPRCVEGREIEEDVFPKWLMEQRPRSLDLLGYFHFDTAHYAPFRDFFRSLLRPVEEIERPLKQAVEQLRKGGNTLVALHIRRGDFGGGPWFIAPTQWYVSFLHEIWPSLHNPVLLVASDEPQKILGDFREFGPLTAEGLGLHLPQAPFYPDFYLLCQCDVLAISNSSFSFAAAMLNDRARVFCRPHLHLKRLIPFHPWNSAPLLHRELAKPLRQVIAELSRQKSGDEAAHRGA
ncbi:MAG: hypothetical protein ABR964_01165 [Tepidisphaeraceae bacterium]|jgi:hypothetical protein